MKHNYYCMVGLLCLLLAAGSVSAQGGAQIVTGHIPKVKTPLPLTAPLEASTHLKLAIGLPLRNQAGLTNLLRELYDPRSPNFHQFLTPDQFAEQFGPDEADYQAVINFANANHLKVLGTYSNRLLVDVDGSVGDIESAFHLKLQRYQHPTEKRTFYAPDREPSLDLSTRILHVSGLDNYLTPRPLYVKKAPGGTPAGAKPADGSGPDGAYMGNDFRAAYVPGTALNGSGQVVGLLEFDGYFRSDIVAYETQAGLTNVPLKNVLLDGFNGVPGSANVEVALDIDMAISMAPALQAVIIYEGETTDGILNRMATDGLAKQLSASWTYGIDAVSAQIFQQFAAQGQSFFNASGDGDAWVGEIATPADNPYITIVGGTTLTTTGPGGAWESETVWNWDDGIGSGGGISTTYAIPSWQQGVDMTNNGGSTTMRNIPDVALTADNVFVVADDGESESVGGTSCATPLWAGFIALVNQQAVANGRPTAGFINPAVYALGEGANYPYTFHDITTGDNTSEDSPTNFYAVTGYDLCAGWGTPSGTNLIDALAPLDALQISPAAGFATGGRMGGPFNVTARTFVLTNAGSSALEWSLGAGTGWLTASPAAGSLIPGGPAATVLVSLNANASNLLVGDYSALLAFTNLTDGVVQSRSFTLTVAKPPVIVVAPTNQAVLGGATAVFSVSVAGGLPMAYQWQFNGTHLTDTTNISGTQSTTLTLSEVSPAEAGSYSVVASNIAGVVTSTPAAQLTLIPSAPVLTSQPAGRTVLFGASVQLAVRALGSAPLYYQWRCNGTNLADGGNLSGSATAILNIDSASAATAGTYSVVVSNTLGTALSVGAAVTVYARSDTELVANGSFETGDFSSWTESGNFMLTAVNGDSMYAYVGNYGAMCGPSGALGNLSQSVPTTPGATYLLSLWLDSPDGLGPDEFTVTWDGNALFDQVNLPAIGWTNLQFTVTASGSATSLELGFRDDQTFLGLDAISLKPLQSPAGAPVITVQPPAQALAIAGTTATIPVVAAGRLPLSYQWQSNGVVMPGMVGPTLTLPGATTNQSAAYSVVISNSLGVTVSSNAVLTVLAGNPSLLTFDDLAESGLAVPSGYGNLNWQNFYYIAGGDYRQSGYFAGMISAPNVAYNGYGEPAYLASSSGSFSLLSAYVTAAWNDNLRLEVKGLANSALVYHQSFTLSATNPTFINFNCVGVTAIEFISSGGTGDPGYPGTGTHFVLDNVTVMTEPPPQLDTLYAFGGADGGWPNGPLVQGADGSFYGTTEYGGANNFGTVFRMTTNGFSTLVSFASWNGANPQAGLVLGSDGNLYGTTEFGGDSGAGTVFRVSTNGALTTLASLTYSGGGYPSAALVQGNDGAFYGTASGGGPNYDGAVFRVTTNGALTTLVTFTGTNGSSPAAALLQGADGNFYGTTPYGGLDGDGTIFQMTPGGTLRTLASFAYGNGAYPYSPLIQDADGNFYGTTEYGGTNYAGTLFELTADGTLTTLVNFNDDDGSTPMAGLVRDASGNFYGTTQDGGLYGDGALFELATNGAVSVLRSFMGTNGADVQAGLVWGDDKNLYGVSSAGGVGYDGSSSSGDGTIFRLDLIAPPTISPIITAQPISLGVPAGGSVTFGVSALSSAPLTYSWRRNDLPIAGATQSTYTTNGVQLADDGNQFSCLVSNLYGTALSSNAALSVYSASFSGPIHMFNGVDGGNAFAGLIYGADGLLYGTTEYGGTNGQGCLFCISPNGSLTTLFSFNQANGAQPMGALVQGSDGAFYGTTSAGGADDWGTVFRWTTNGLSTLVSFTYQNGGDPNAGLTLASDGNLYGTTSAGGVSYYGTVFRVTTNGGLTTLVSFNSDNGSYPYAPLVQGADGALYGTTSSGGTNYDGTVFRVTTNGGFATLANFSEDTGYDVNGALVQGADGNFYGTAEFGGPDSDGVIFKVTTNGTLTDVVAFDYSNGGEPGGGLLQDASGYFYGTTFYGGELGSGTVFRWGAGILTNLHSFAGTDGSNPESALVLGTDGNLYGTTTAGGAGYDGDSTSGDGTVFRVVVPGVSGAPVIAVQPAPAVVAPGGAANFFVEATGREPLYYFWQRNGESIAGANGSSYTLNNVRLADSGSQFSCLVSNAYGTVLSSNAWLTVSENLVQNGGFETGDFTGWGGSKLGASVTSNALYVHSGFYGAQFGPSGELGYLSQTLATTAGSSYSVSLWLDNEGGTPNEFQVSWNGTLLYDGIDLPAFGWTNLTFVATATSSSILQFGFRQDPNYLGLDDVSVTPYSPFPSITRMAWGENNGLEIDLSGSVGETFRVLGSTNLVDWVTVAALTNLTGTLRFEDPTATKYGCRFYRLVTP
jgi:uncharacterized repeat protein (TIGR03803 family)